MLIAVTGGTGFVGRSVVSELLSQGHDVRILARKAPETPPGDNLSFFRGDVVTGVGLEPFLKGADAVVHLVGIIRQARANTFESVHHFGTEKVLDAAVAAGVGRFVHMSALGTRPHAVSAYHRTKWAAEETVRSGSLPWTVFRPSIIFGPGDAFINMLAEMIRKTPVMPVIGGGKNLMQPVSVKDVAASFRRVVESSAHEGKTYELGGPEILTFREILEKTAKAIGKKRVFIPFPAAFIRPPVALFQGLGLPFPVTTDQLTMLKEDNIRMGGDPIEDLRIQWTGFEEGIKQYLVPGA